MSFLRFLIFLSLIVWLGGLIFFPVVAQTAFSVLPTRHLAGLMVGRSLGILHWMGIVSGLVFLASSLTYNWLTRGAAHPFAARHVLIVPDAGAYADFTIRSDSAHGCAAGYDGRD